MAQGGYIGNGIRVAYSVSSPLSYQKLEQVIDATPPKLKADVIDTTRHSANRYKSNIPGMYDVSPVTIKMLRDADPATSPKQNALQALQNASTTLYLRIEVPTNAQQTLFEAWEISGRFSDWGVTPPIMGRVELDVSFLFDGVDYIYFGTPSASVIG
jgi:hypothetical protein